MVEKEVEVEWFCSESQADEIYRVRIIKSMISRRDQRPCHTLLFPSGETRRTKLLHERMTSLEKKRKPSNIPHTPSKLLRKNVLPPHRFILAPMVGGSELAFRMLCRRYGIDLAYTPMMNSELFAVDPEYRQEEFQTNPDDRPLVAHFSGNNPEIMLAAARHVEHSCDAIDLNLGCPQRIAHSGHFGSYLLGQEDRETVLQIVRTLSSSLSIPVFVKIRLLDTVEDTLELCCQLRDAGAALIAIHGRYRVNLVGRTGPGARDGPAHLDQIQFIKQQLGSSVRIVANGNIITHEDVLDNLSFTEADGVMSAEGILDNPALFFQESGSPPSSLHLALEYLDCVARFGPVKMKSVVFHTRRICRKEFEKYNLLEDCVAAENADQVRKVVQEALDYETGTKVFHSDAQKQKRAKEALAKRKQEESKRKLFEERMVRKAKREGLSDLLFYLNQGAENPSLEDLSKLKSMDKTEAFAEWKKRFSQHCYSFHFDSQGCPRDRKCAFLHADPRVSEGEIFG